MSSEYLSAEGERMVLMNQGGNGYINGKSSCNRHFGFHTRIPPSSSENFELS